MARNDQGSPTSRPAAYFTLRMDERTVRAIRDPLYAVTSRHRAGGGFDGDIGDDKHFFVSFVAVEACDQFERELRARGIWFRRTRECPIELEAVRMIRGTVHQPEPQPFFAMLIIEAWRAG